jgi:hypothetical protein
MRRADVLAAQRMAGLARILDQIDPVALVCHELRNAVALVAGARELVGAWNRQHRIPVHSRVIFRGGSLRRCERRCQVQRLTRLAVDTLGVDQPVAARPHLVVGLRQVGDDVTAGIVGDDDFGVTGRQVERLRDHPNTCLGACPTADNAADVCSADGQRVGGRVGGLSAGGKWHRQQAAGDSRREAGEARGTRHPLLSLCDAIADPVRHSTDPELFPVLNELNQRMGIPATGKLETLP